MAGKKFWNAVPACVLLRKNFLNGIPSQKYLCIQLLIYVVVQSSSSILKEIDGENILSRK
jgi:hypothetical protein